MHFIKNLNQKLFAEITEVPTALKNTYYPTLDGLRAVAILIVVLAHIGLNKYLKYCGLNIDSTTGVHIFFVISGFLITTLLLKEKLNNGYISLKRFYVRRALRILPVAYLFLLILILLNNLYQLKIPATNFIASFLFYKNLPMPNEPYSAHFWSLAVEEQFYITFPVLLALNINRYIIIALVIVIIIPAIAIFAFYNPVFLQGNFTWHLISKVSMYAFWKGPVIILIGSVFSIALFKGMIKPEQIKVNYFLSFILIILAVVITSKCFLFYREYSCEYVAAILVAIALILSINTPDFLSRILSNVFLRRIGILSYSIYIWQQLFVNSRAWQPWLHVFSNYPLWALIILKLIIIGVIALMSYKFEAIFLRIKTRYGNNK